VESAATRRALRTGHQPAFWFPFLSIFSPYVLASVVSVDSHYKSSLLGDGKFGDEAAADIFNGFGEREDGVTFSYPVH